MGAQEEVKIAINAESQGNGFQTTEAGLNKITEAGKRANEAAQKAAQPHRGQVTSANGWDKQKTESGGSKAKDARDSRALIAYAERDLLSAKAKGLPAEEIAKREKNLREEKLTARFQREQGLSYDDAYGKASEMVTAQETARKREAAERAAGKARVEAEKTATREMQEQEQISKRLTVRLGGIAATGAVAIGGALLTDYFERQGIQNRDTASRSLNTRQLQIQSGLRGTTTGLQAEEWAAQDQLAELKAQEPELQRKKTQGIWQTALKRGGQFGAAGAGLGLLGAGVGAGPGGLIGGGIGLVTGALEGWMDGRRSLQENTSAQKREADKIAATAALKQKKLPNEEAGLELDALRERSKRTQEGFYKAQIDDFKQQYLAEKRRMNNMGMTDPNVQDEAGRLTVENQIRERQAAVGNSLVDARSGAGDIAAAARWADMATVTVGAFRQALDNSNLHETLKNSGDKAGGASHFIDFSK